MLLASCIPTAVRTRRVVFLSPRVDAHAGQRFRNQLTFKHSSRSLPLKLSTCAFCNGLSWLNVGQLQFPVCAPTQEMPRGQFAAVVHDQTPRASALHDDFIKHPSHTPACKARIHFQRQTLARERVHHPEHADRASTGEARIVMMSCSFVVIVNVLPQNG